MISNLHIRHQSAGFVRAWSLWTILALVSSAAHVLAAECEPDGLQSSGAVYRICMPEAGQWNGDLVVYAHGYVAFNRPVEIPEDHLQLPDGASIPDIFTSLGYAFATTSFSVNGLAVKQGVDDVVELVDIFETLHGEAGYVYIVGVSEGGLVTTLAVEKHPDVFDGGGAACGPVGSFVGQIDYYGRFRVVFDYLFPGLLPGTAIDIPEDLENGWEDYYADVLAPALYQPGNEGKLAELVEVCDLPFDSSNLITTVQKSIEDALWYCVMATEDAAEKLGGQPFGNRYTRYQGSDNDLLLNLGVARYQADPAALRETLTHYTSSGNLTRPLVMLHTTLDQQVPYWHEVLYALKVRAAGAQRLHTIIPINRYGHCEFETSDVALAFAVLVYKVSHQPLANLARVVRDPAKKLQVESRLKQLGVPVAR